MYLKMRVLVLLGTEFEVAVLLPHCEDILPVSWLLFMKRLWV